MEIHLANGKQCALLSISMARGHIQIVRDCKNIKETSITSLPQTRMSILSPVLSVATKKFIYIHICSFNWLFSFNTTICSTSLCSEHIFLIPWASDTEKVAAEGLHYKLDLCNHSAASVSETEKWILMVATLNQWNGTTPTARNS